MADIPRSNPDAPVNSADESAIAGSGSYSVALPGTEDASALRPEPYSTTEPSGIQSGTTDMETQVDQPGFEDSAPRGEETALNQEAEPSKAEMSQVEPGSQSKRGFGLRSLQWLSLLITLPFLGLNGLAAWQVHSLTHYSQAQADSRPTFALPPLKRLGAFLFGVKVPRPENEYNPADLGFAFDSHRIDLGNGEFLDGWYVPAPQAAPPKTQPESEPESTDAEPTDVTGEAPRDASSSEAQGEPVAEASEEGAGFQVVPEPIQASEKQGVVLLFPAYAASKQTLLQEIKLLHRIGYATFAVDFRGVGDSSGSDTTLGRREAEDVAVTVDYVKKTFENPPIALYGRIMGASHVMRAIAEFDIQPNALILEDPYAQLFSLTQTVVESVGLPRSPTTQMLTLWGGVLQGEDPAYLDPITYASEITAPTLVLYGSEASWVSLDEVVAVHSQLQGSKEILGLSSARDMPVSATAVGSWMGKVETFLEGNMGQ